MNVRPLDTLLAIKAIGLEEGLRPSDRRVGVLLLEHYNRRTGRCDPSMQRMGSLLGLSVRTIIRSTQRLEKAGLFRKTRHGGNFNNNFYEPMWARFADLHAAWQSRLGRKTRSPKSAEVSPATSRSCHIPRDPEVTQTCSWNLSKQTYPKRLSNEQMGRRLTAGALSKPIGAARIAAERRWTQQLHQEFASRPVTYGEVISAIDERMQNAATDAEMHRRGAGLALIFSQLKLPGAPTSQSNQ